MRVTRPPGLVVALLFLLIALPARAFVAFQLGADDPVHYPDHAAGRSAEKPWIEAKRLGAGPIHVDGRLDEAAWSTASSGWGFVQFEPDRGIEPSEQTVFKVLYDDEAIYFGVACFESDVSLTTSALSRRDNIQNSDLISIYVDPYHDRTTGYNFRVNPDGSKVDSYLYNDGENRDIDWDAVWDVETHRDANGWYAEFRVPFSSVRYRPQDEMTWGLQIYRWMHGRGEDTGWANWERNAAGFVSRFGELRGLRDVPAARQLEVSPYVVQRSTDPAASGDEDAWDGFQNVGADLKYGVTADLTLNATVQPDFGQVEADPAVLNLSPFETFYEEKRPFFIEGARFFEQPSFSLFYSRRIGTGDENQRIRYASKLIGKTAGDVSVATLFAATDVTGEGQAHNVFKSGERQNYFAVARFGKEFAEGAHRFHVMQTAVWRDESLRQTLDDDPRDSRDGYSTGADFELSFDERSWRLFGEWVGTVVDDAPVAEDPTVGHGASYGTGGRLGMGKYGGKWRGSLVGRWESDRLDPNDMGLLFAPDEVSSSAWVQRRFDPGEDSAITQGNLNFNLYSSWLYAGRVFLDPASPGSRLWSYDRFHRQSRGGNVNGWVENRHRWQTYYGVSYDAEGTSKYETRAFEGMRGPLVSVPASGGFWWGFSTDWRKDYSLNFDLESYWDEAGGRYSFVGIGGRWVQGSRLSYSLRLNYVTRLQDAQWVDNRQSGSGGIGGVNYVFGTLDQSTLDITLRSHVLFTRDQSLELYVQPFLATGDYSDARELVRPDSYEFSPYSETDWSVDDEDFRLGSVNLNLVYRWEYRPGSTFYLVWTHSRGQFRSRGEAANPDAFETGLDRETWLRNEPENTILAKLSYWFSI